MKYMLLIYGNREEASQRFREQSDDALDTLIRDHRAFEHELAESGELISAEGLADPVNAKSVRVLGERPAVTDGPFVESKELLAGYYLVDCDGLERALELASRVPDARFNAVEVRPVMDVAGMEM